MSRFKTKSKQALIIVLALLLFFAMVPSSLPGGLAYADTPTEYPNSSLDDPAGLGFWGVTVSTNKARYDIGEDIYIKYEGQSSIGSSPWIGLMDTYAAGGENQNYENSLYWAPLTGDFEGKVINNTDSSDAITGLTKSKGITEPGIYYVIANAADGRYAVCKITVGPEDSLATDKTMYKVGEPIMVTSTSSAKSAWVGLWDIVDPADLENPISWYYVKDSNGEPYNILDGVSDTLVGRYRVIFFQSGYDVGIIKTFWIGEYGDPTWSWNEGHTEAVATFTEKDNPTVTATAKVTETDITSVDNAATCTAAANTTYTATLTADKLRFLTVEEGPFTTTVVVETGTALGHTWGEWTVVTPATEETEGLERRECSVCHETEEQAIPKLDHVHSVTPVAAKEATCEEDGNIAYYVCDGCGKYFEDAEATIEIGDKTTVVIPAKGHAYGEWVFDAENKQHVKTCSNDASHVIRENCTFVDGEVVDGQRTHTCSVCGGTYTTSVDPVITTDKTAYKYGEAINVTTQINEATGGWIALYPKGVEAYNTSLYWYYPQEFSATRALLPDYEIDTNKENYGSNAIKTEFANGVTAGEYELVYVTGSSTPYTRVGQPTYFTVYYEYNDPTWTWAEDGSSATATFAANGKPDVIETAADTAPAKAVKTPATCTETGVDTYTATVTVDFATVSGETTFTNSKDITSAALGHDFGEWTVVTPATETTTGLERRECSRCDAFETRDIPVLTHVHGLTAHPATPATCAAEGNTAYWVCDQGDNPCGKYFDDAEGTHEIEPNSWIIPKTNEHDYGDWVFDGADKKTHTKTCSRDASHKVTESCTFVDSEPVNGKITHTCSVCGGSYTTDVLLSTDKDTYKITDPIMVTLNYEGDGSAWVGLYGKNETPNAEANPRSIYWYNVKEKDGTYNKTYDLTKGTKNRDYGPGEYKVILFGDGGFTNILDTKYITITDKEPSTLMIDKAAPAEYTMGDPIMVTATSDYPDAWVGLYDYTYSDPLNETLLSWYNLSDSNGEPVDIWNGNIVKDKEKLEGLPSGKYKVILFSSEYKIDTGADGNLLIRSFDLKDNSGCEHNWGKWIPDEDADTHTRECSICHMKETKPCTYTHAPSSDPGVELFTCTECKRQYEKVTVPVITLNEENGEYELGEDILVTTELNGVNGGIGGGWIALQYRGESYDNKSLLWYYPACFDNPKLLQSVLTPSDTNIENVNGDRGTDEWTEIPVGEYELVFLDPNYKKVGEPTYFTVVKGVESEKVTKEPTCTEKGIKHIVYKDGTEEDVKIDALGHDPKTEWVHDAEKRTHYHECSRCGERINETACTFDEGKVTKEPTATEEGEMLYTCTVCKGTYTEPIPTLANQGVKRVYGDTRYQTSLLQANELKEYLKLEKFDNIIVATGTNYADALSGSYLGYVKAAPIILVRNSDKAVVADVKDYIKNNLKPGGTVYLLGGEAVVTGDVTKGLDVKTERLSGPTRYETNIEILKAAGVGDKAIMVCDGTGFADSLSASAAKLPILLVKRGLNDGQRKYLDTLNGNDFYLIGGTGVLPKALEDEIGSNYGAVERLGGADRYETSTKVAEKLFKNPDKAVVAYAMNYPDGLCGGTLAAYMDAPLLLVRDDKTAVTVNYAKKAGVKSGMVLGGSTLVSDKSVRDIFQMSEKDEIYVVNKMTPMTK